MVSGIDEFAEGLSGVDCVILEWHSPFMEYDEGKVDEMVLALLYLTLHDGRRVWKGFDWNAMNRLHEEGMILDPKGKAKSVVLSEDGVKRCEALFQQHFGSPK